MSKIKEKAKESTAKRALKYLNTETGGILEASSASSLPCGRQQISDARRKGVNKEDHDQLYAVMYMCKEGEGQKCKDSFVRVVNAAPFPMMVLSFDYTLDDLVRFCTGERHCVLGVDPTFNLGKFDVTVTTYQHLLLELKVFQGSHLPCWVPCLSMCVRILQPTPFLAQPWWAKGQSLAQFKLLVPTVNWL